MSFTTAYAETLLGALPDPLFVQRGAMSTSSSPLTPTMEN
jgi:hypothetical protein